MPKRKHSKASGSQAVDHEVIIISDSEAETKRPSLRRVCTFAVLQYANVT
jgi:hypothetical protein